VLTYLTRHAPSLKNRTIWRAPWPSCMPFYAGKPLSALPDVARSTPRRKGDVKPATVKNRLAYLRAACRWAWKHEGWASTTRPSGWCCPRSRTPGTST
jgi:hypothetical protein